MGLSRGYVGFSAQMMENQMEETMEHEMETTT